MSKKKKDLKASCEHPNPGCDLEKPRFLPPWKKKSYKDVYLHFFQDYPKDFKVHRKLSNLLSK
jgi:hypothetical protein